jgi:N-acetylmuramic acid 6-phosphate etherase
MTVKKLNGAQCWIENPPSLDKNEIVRFIIGNEPDDSRITRKPNAAILVVSGSEASSREFAGLHAAFNEQASAYLQAKTLIVGDYELHADFKISCDLLASPLRLMEHLAMKLVLNTVSTGTMVLLGRVTSNWMSWVEVSNKKLRDRGIRLISELCGVTYREACYVLHMTLHDPGYTTETNKTCSPVQYAIRHITSLIHRVQRKV